MTVWLGPAGLGVRAAGYDSTLAIGGSLMPVFYKMDTWFYNPSADFSGPGSPEGEMIWGFAMYEYTDCLPPACNFTSKYCEVRACRLHRFAMLVACMLGSGDSGLGRNMQSSVESNVPELQVRRDVRIANELSADNTDPRLNVGISAWYKKAFHQ